MKKQTDRHHARLLRWLMLENDFPQIWVPSAENRDLRQLLWHRQQVPLQLPFWTRLLPVGTLMDGFLADYRVRLFSAIRAGRFSEHTPLDDQLTVFAEVIGADSLDLVELDMALEAQGVRLRNLADLVRYLEDSDPDSPGVVVRP